MGARGGREGSNLLLHGKFDSKLWACSLKTEAVGSLSPEFNSDNSYGINSIRLTRFLGGAIRPGPLGCGLALLGHYAFVSFPTCPAQHNRDGAASFSGSFLRV